MITDYVNKRWHSLLQANRKLLQLVQQVGLTAINHEGKYKKVRETRIAMIVSLILSKIHNSPTYLRIPKREHEPPDAYLMHPSPINYGYFRVVALEVTEYFGNHGNLLEQLKDTNIFDNYNKFPCGSLLVADLHTLGGIDYYEINDFLKQTQTPFAVWTIHRHSGNPESIVEVVRIGTDSKPFHVIVSEEAYRKIYAGVHAILIMKRTGKHERSHIEDSYTSVYDIAPW